MPLLGLHMTAARELAGELASPVIDADRGAFYLGATTPDIRVITRWDRERTHFFNLDEFGEQDGVHRLFDQEPGLRDAAALTPATASFMAGYISHLVLDQDYICQIYRPLFGSQSPLSGDEKANLMDRMLQFEMDRHDREDPAVVDEIRQALVETALDVTVDFIGRDTLLQWRDRSVEVLAYAPTWERFGKIASRYLAAAGIEGDEIVETFIAEVPILLRRTIDHVGEERIREYMHDAKSRARRAMREYLS
jgi:hypothetical protein